MIINLRALALTGRSAVRLAWVALLALALSASADIVYTLDDGQLGGTATLTPGDAALTLTDAQGKAQSLKLIDLDRVRFNVDPETRRDDQVLLIDNDKGTGTRQKQATIKLRAGLHRITLPYWQATGEHRLAVFVAGPGLNGRSELGSTTLRCFRDTDDVADASEGLDADGYRLPELALEEADNRRRMLSRSRYRLYTSDQPIAPANVTGIGGMQLKRAGTTSAVNTGMLNEHNANVGIVFDAFFIAKQDGEYTFTITSDDGAQLYFGQVDSFSTEALNEPAVSTPWRAELAHGGLAKGELKSIADETLTFHIPLVSDVTVALNHTRALWDSSVEPTTINRENEPTNEDTVYLRDKNDPKMIRSVSGKISGVDDTSLKFVFRGQERSITRDRVVGLVFKHDSRPTPPPPGTHAVLILQGGQILPANVKSIDKHIAFEILGGGMATPPREVLKTLRVENGRRIDLTRQSPNAEEAIPYFGLELKHKVNTNFSGKPIRLYDDKVYTRGLAVHSKSRLHYRLKPNCDRFQAGFGLLNPGGKLGDVTARVLGDGKVLWEQANITAESRMIQVDVPLKGVERLVLEVDFGGGQNVGDRAAWVEPRLIYSAEGDGQ
ncbi:MAG: NPCBM/NEW2 domain-containing protein [Planctomycetota bacterium]